MEKRIHLYVSRKNALTWLMALCLVGSAVTRIAFAGLKGSGDPLSVWSQIVLPVAACLLYALIAALTGKEHFYKTAIPVWMAALYSGIWINQNVPNRMIVWLFWIALIFFAVIYTEVSCGKKRHPYLLFLIWLGAGIAGIYFVNKTECLCKKPKALFRCFRN